MKNKHAEKEPGKTTEYLTVFLEEMLTEGWGVGRQFAFLQCLGHAPSYLTSWPSVHVNAGGSEKSIPMPT